MGCPCWKRTGRARKKRTTNHVNFLPSSTAVVLPGNRLHQPAALRARRQFVDGTPILAHLLQEGGEDGEIQTALQRSLPHDLELVHANRPDLVVGPTHGRMDHGASMTRIGHAGAEAHIEAEGSTLRIEPHQPAIEMADIGALLEQPRGERVRNGEVHRHRTLRHVPHQPLSRALIGLAGDPEPGIGPIRQIGRLAEQVGIFTSFRLDEAEPLQAVGEHVHLDSAPSEVQRHSAADLRGRPRDHHGLALQTEHFDQLPRALDHGGSGKSIAMNERNAKQLAQLLHDPLTSLGHALVLTEGAETHHVDPGVLSCDHRPEDLFTDPLAEVEAFDHELVGKEAHQPDLPVQGAAELEPVNHIVGLAPNHADDREQERDGPEDGPTPGVGRVPLEIVRPLEPDVPGLNPMSQEHVLPPTIRFRLLHRFLLALIGEKMKTPRANALIFICLNQTKMKSLSYFYF